MSDSKADQIAKRGRWKKGQSGNPGGRPRDLPWLRELARSHAPDAVAKLVEIMRTGAAKDARAAADSLLDRGFGKAAIVQAGEGGEGAAGITVTIRDLAAERKLS